MKSKHVILVAILIAVGSMMYYTLGNNDKQYKDRLIKKREQRELELLNSRKSPIKNIKKFKGLSFFKPNKKYIVEAYATPIESKKMVLLATSDGQKRLYRHYAKLSFDLNDKLHSLVLLQNAEDNSDFFLPFNDQTNGTQTYGAGRYLDIKAKDIKPKGDFTLRLDFNLAYNPYCAYNPDYSCPIPPKANNLETRIEAGEMYNSH